MRQSINILILSVVALAGCESGKQADLRAREAYLAGQQQAAKQWQFQQSPQVAVHGPVRNPVVPWTDGLTLAKAIVDAEYTAFMNPLSIRVVRNGQIVNNIKGVDLLHGQDFALQPGDIVEILP